MGSKIFLTGFMGSGKTFWGRIWAGENHLRFFDLDEEIEKAEGQTIPAIFEDKGEEYFRDKERDILVSFGGKDSFILACGGGTPCFFENLQWMNEQGITIYLRASPGEILSRIKNEIHERPLLTRSGRPELLSFIEEKLREREPFYRQAKYIFDVNILTHSSLGEIINKKAC